jgi:dienelactone hydrolase
VAGVEVAAATEPPAQWGTLNANSRSVAYNKHATVRLAPSFSEMRATPMKRFTIAMGVVLSLLPQLPSAADAAKPRDTSRGDEMIAAYFRAETQKLANACLANIKNYVDWTRRRGEYRRQMREMLGLDPLPERTRLRPIITGKLEHDEFTVEKLHFQSLPHLYVTGNLYLPKNDGKRFPTVLYVCGHHRVKKDGVSYGNKTWYQYHGAWFAQNGYVCLVIDTLQLGEIEGSHRGTRDEGKWWWNARGYTPAGVETWNAIRALEYLVSRPEVDAKRIGVTGRSGGGAYSWYLAALEDRVKVVVPVAGITSLKNHVVDDCVTGHCDCMYFVNTYRWDYAQLAALTTPRPLLIANTDRDHIFPLDGVVDIYGRVRRLYELNNKGPDIALQLTPGPHSDGQVLQLQALQWFNRYLKGEKTVAAIESAAKSYFTPEELKVFDELPADEINTRIDELLVPIAAPPPPPESEAEWQLQRDQWMMSLREKCFRGWPAEGSQPATSPRTVLKADISLPGQTGALDVTQFQFTSQDGIELPLVLIEPAGIPRNELKRIMVWPVSAEEWSKFTISRQLGIGEPGPKKRVPIELDGAASPWPDTRSLNSAAILIAAPRGIGPTAWTSDVKASTNIRRRFMLLGQTLDSMRVWDVRRAIQAVRQIDGLADLPLTLKGEREMAGIALYAALFEPGVERLELRALSPSHRTGPDFLNVLRVLDLPQTVAMVAEKSPIELTDQADTNWEYPLAVAKNLGWYDRIKISKAEVSISDAPNVELK